MATGKTSKTKGKNGEREAVKMLQAVIDEIREQLDLPTEKQAELATLVQRNTSQSAIGGCDIEVFNLAIEIKRCETLQLEKWWMQAYTSAQAKGREPILLYRQNRKSWKVKLWVKIPFGNLGESSILGEIEIDTFLVWFYEYALSELDKLL